MKGQRLFIRPATSDDLVTLHELDPEFTQPEGELALVARLVGSTAAAARVKVNGQSAELTWMAVTPALRRLRVGSKLLHYIAAELPAGVSRLTIRKGLLPSEFLAFVGFHEDGATFTLDIRQ